jgi:hypothetical protein
MHDRFAVLGGGDYQLSDGTYHVLRNGQSYSFDPPDFNFRQLDGGPALGVPAGLNDWIGL